MSDSPELELPVAAYECPNCGSPKEPNELNGGSYECPDCHYGSDAGHYSKSEFAFTRVSDAEDAIQEARQNERQKLLDKWRELDNKIHCGIDTYQAWNKLKEDLRDDLQERDERQ